MNDHYDVQFATPLERHFEELLAQDDAHNKFPYVAINRMDLYRRIKSNINKTYYRDTDAGLAAHSGGGAFTHHDLGHVDDVIRKAGQLLGAGTDIREPPLANLTHHEVFVLLVACLIHDAGNKEGRLGHASKARSILRSVSDGSLDEKELSLISKIAEAHGGTTVNGSKDTIGHLRLEDGVEQSRIRPRHLAAILRLADELAENPRRASTRSAELSEFPNQYCRAISVRVDCENRALSLHFCVADDDCELFGRNENDEEMYFVDYIRSRVVKTELERRYCDRYLRGFATFEVTRVNIEFIRNDQEWNNIHFELKEDGYPDLEDDSVLSPEALSGATIASQYQAHCQRLDDHHE